MDVTEAPTTAVTLTSTVILILKSTTCNLTDSCQHKSVRHLFPTKLGKNISPSLCLHPETDYHSIKPQLHPSSSQICQNDTGLYLNCLN